MINIWVIHGPPGLPGESGPATILDNIQLYIVYYVHALHCLTFKDRYRNNDLDNNYFIS